MQLGVFWGHGQALSVSLSGDVNYLDVSSSGISTSKKSRPSSPVSCLTVAHSEIVIGCNDGTVSPPRLAQNGPKYRGATAALDQWGGARGQGDISVCHF